MTYHCFIERRHSHVHLHTPLKPLGTSSSSHHHHSKKDKDKKGHKKRKHRHEESRKSPEKRKVSQGTETDQDKLIPGEEPNPIVDESLETNLVTDNVDIVDQTISVLPEITEHVILSTPPTHSFLAEQPEPVVTDISKDSKPGRHRKKHNESHDGKDPGKSSHSHHKHRHRHKMVKLQERRRPGAATLMEGDKAKLDTPKIGEEEEDFMDTKDAEDMACELDSCFFVP